MTALGGALLACLIVGHLVDRGLLDDPSSTWIERLGRALMLGLGTLGTLSMLLDVVGLGVSLASVGGAALVVSVVLAWSASRRRRAGVVPSPPTAAPMTGKEHLVHGALLAFGAFGLLIAVRSGWIRPTFQFDSLLRWMFKAKVLYHDGTLTGPISTDAFYAVTHQRYPPLVSHIAALPSLGAERFDDRITSAMFPFYAVAMAAVVYGALARRVGRLTGALAVAWIGNLPLVSYLLAAPPGAGASSAMADIPLSLFVTGAALAAADLVDDRRPRALLEAGLLAGFAALTKNEGGPFLVALALGIVVASRSQRWRRAAIVAGTGAGLFVAAWWSLAWSFPALDEDYLGQLSNMEALKTGVERLGLILPEIGVELLSFRLWNVTWLAAVVLLVVGGRAGIRRPDVRLLLVVLVAQLATYVFAYMITRWTSPAAELVSQGKDTLPFLMTLTLGRLLMHVAPLAICAGLVAAPLTLRRSG